MRREFIYDEIGETLVVGEGRMEIPRRPVNRLISRQTSSRPNLAHIQLGEHFFSRLIN